MLVSSTDEISVLFLWNDPDLKEFYYQIKTNETTSSVISGNLQSHSPSIKNWFGFA